MVHHQHHFLDSQRRNKDRHLRHMERKKEEAAVVAAESYDTYEHEKEEAAAVVEAAAAVADYLCSWSLLCRLFRLMKPVVELALRICLLDHLRQTIPYRLDD